MKVIPTIFSHKKEEFDSRLKKLLPIAKEFQVDIMDGKFVPSKSVSLAEIPNLKRLGKKFELHLMVKNLENYISDAKKLGFSKIIFHYEALQDSGKVNSLIKLIKKSKIGVFIALNPETPLSSIISFVNNVDGVLFMGVHPGKEHQEFIPSVFDKIWALKKFNPKIVVEVDGGVNLKVAHRLRELGVDIVNAGSFVAESSEPGKAMKELENA